MQLAHRYGHCKKGQERSRICDQKIENILMRFQMQNENLKSSNT